MLFPAYKRKNSPHCLNHCCRLVELTDHSGFPHFCAHYYIPKFIAQSLVEMFCLSLYIFRISLQSVCTEVVSVPVCILFSDCVLVFFSFSILLLPTDLLRIATLATIWLNYCRCGFNLSSIQGSVPNP